jgi:hypothetical protein
MSDLGADCEQDHSSIESGVILCSPLELYKKPSVRCFETLGSGHVGFAVLDVGATPRPKDEYWR